MWRAWILFFVLISLCLTALPGGIVHSSGGAEKVMVFDAHCDTALRIVDEEADIGLLSGKGHVTIAGMEEGGVGIQVFALWPHPSSRPHQVTHRILRLLDGVLGTIDKYPGKMALALTASDARRITWEGKRAIFLAIEGGEAIENDLGVLRMFHRLGVRSMTITWMNNTDWADSSTGDAPRFHGLSGFGVKVVREMNRTGMVIDISHVSSETMKDILQVSEKPVIASHSCCRAICDHPRNLKDDELQALSKKGGVVCINFAPDYLDQKYNEKFEEIQRELKPQIEQLEKKPGDDKKRLREMKRALYRERMGEVPAVTLDKVVEHIEHAVKVAGVDHVGIGSDFDGIGATPAGLEDCSKLQSIAVKLREKGYSADDLDKIFHGNLLRVYQDVIGE